MFCRRCGAPLHQGVVICPECGARQRRGISSVRCARCGHRVSLGLTVCPHCGRDVHPAGPRWGLWLAGFAIIALAGLWGLGELPIDRIETEAASLRSRAGQIVQFLGPAASPAGVDRPTPTTQAVAAINDKPTPTATPEPTGAAPVEASPTEAAPTEAAPVQSSPEASPTVAATETPIEPTPTPSPTLEPTPTMTPLPTETPTPEPTTTPTTAPTPTQALTASGPVTYKVQSGDTLSSIAAKFGIEWQALAQANKLTSRSTLRIGQELVIPGAAGAVTPAPSGSNASTASATYTVKSGDSLATIAAKYGITWQELAAANGLASTARLRIGQTLVIPGKGGAPTPTAPPTAAPIARPAASPTPAPAVLLPAPQLLNPGDQASYGGSGALVELKWKAVDGIPSGAGYRVSIQWTEGGLPMDYQVPLTTATSIRMPAWLFGKADQPTRQYTWSVRIVETTTDGQGREKDLLLSPSSESRVLYWY